MHEYQKESLLINNQSLSSSFVYAGKTKEGGKKENEY